MSGGRLSPLQQRILKVLAGHDLGWVLTGGGALAGFHLQHRETRDLDLFWRGRRELAELPREVEARLQAAGLAVEVLQSGLTFCRLRVRDDTEVCVLDLVAEPMMPVNEPSVLDLEEQAILVDTPREILASKLCALLGRSEVRDLVDVRALLDAGADFDVALRDAAQKDGGFSPLTLAWVLRGFDVGVAAGAIGWNAPAAEALARFQEELIERLLASAAPG